MRVIEEEVIFSFSLFISQVIFCGSFPYFFYFFYQIIFCFHRLDLITYFSYVLILALNYV